MGKHASGQVSWTDTVAAYWTLILAWLSAWTQSTGRHHTADDRTPAAVLLAEPARFSWPGAEPDWAAQIRGWNADDTLRVRPEARA